MNVTYTKEPALKERVLIIGDIHINTKLSEEFETGRLDKLAYRIKKPKDSYDIVVLAGDTFDRAIPSLQDIRLFYKFIINLKGMQKPIYIINGNHDENTFKYIPEIGFTYIHTSTMINDKILLVPYTELGMLEAHLETNKYLDTLLISHARCSIPPYIAEEFPIALMSDSFRYTVLGDIHSQPKLPFDNVMYTTSPSNVTFSEHVKDAHGYVIYDIPSNVCEFIPIAIPTKTLVTCNTIEEARKALTSTHKHFWKVRFRGTGEELRELSKYHPLNTVKDLQLDLGVISEQVPEQASALSEFLGSQVSLSEFAFSYFKNNLNIKEDKLEVIRQLYEKYRTAKGSHK